MAAFILAIPWLSLPCQSIPNSLFIYFAHNYALGYITFSLFLSLEIVVFHIKFKLSVNLQLVLWEETM